MSIEAKGHGMSIALTEAEIDRIYDLLRKPTSVRDYDEVVSLCTIVQKSQWHDNVQTYDSTETMTLREAIRTVIQDWDDDKRKQLRPLILLHTGESIRCIDELRDLYNHFQTSSGLVIRHAATSQFYR